MKHEFVNGSIHQVVGSDKFNALLGANPVGVVFSEYSVANPAAWDYIRPILAENGGWAVFIYTPRGRNHGYRLYEMAKRNPDWYASRLTVDDTCGVVTPAMIQAERDADMSEEMIEQEFFCSFDAPLAGSYYAKEMMAAEKAGRIGNVAYDKAVPVETWWDLGIGDDTAIWFVQRVGTEIHCIDYLSSHGEPLAEYVRIMQGKGYVYSQDVLPHDAQARELQTGKSRMEALKAMGRDVVLLPNHRVEDRIETVRSQFARVWFDEGKCRHGIDALRNYRRELEPLTMWASETEPLYKNRPVHDWASHGADAFGYGLMHTPQTRGNWGRDIASNYQGIR